MTGYRNQWAGGSLEWERLVQKGVGIGDRLVFRPLGGKMKKLQLNRTRYNFRSEFIAPLKDWEYKLGIVNGGKFDIEIQLHSWGSDQDNGRFFVKSLNNRPFRINDTFCLEAFIESGDRLDFEFNQLIFLKNEETPVVRSPEISEELSVLLVGETGTGKSRLAREIHDQGQRPGKFCQLNISSFSPGLLESELFGHMKGAFTGAINHKQGAFLEAQRGTLFLDEIDSLPMELQTKLLLFLDNKKVRQVGGQKSIQCDTRLIFASGRSLESLVEQEKMRKDFYYRVSTGEVIDIKPLREDSSRVISIVREFSQKYYLTLSDTLLEFYTKCPWPGNVRQLLGHLNKKRLRGHGKKLQIDESDRCLLLENKFAKESISEDIISLRDARDKYAVGIYYHANKNTHLAAKLLKVSLATLKKILERHGINQ